MGDMPWGTHFCYFWETKQDLLDASAAFFQAGLENHEFCLWVVLHAVTEADALQALRRSIPGVDRHLASGQHGDRSCTPTARFPNRVPACIPLAGETGRALAQGYAGMRVAGSPSVSAASQYRMVPGIRAGTRQTSRPHTGSSPYAISRWLKAARRRSWTPRERISLLSRDAEGDWEIIETSESQARQSGNHEAQRSSWNSASRNGPGRWKRPTKSCARRSRGASAWKRTCGGRRRFSKPFSITFPSCSASWIRISRIKLVNREFERTLGQTLEEIQDQDVDTVVAKNFPDPEYREQVHDFIRTSDAQWMDFKMQVRDGRVVDTSWAILHLSDGTSVGIGQDISERKQADQELRRQKEVLQIIFDHIPVMIAFVDQNRQLELVNREWERTLGWSLEEIRSQNIDIAAELYPDPEDAPARSRLDDVRMRSGRTSKQQQKTDASIDTTWAVIPLSDGALIGIGQDISERKQAEQELRKQKEILQTIFDHIPLMINFGDKDFVVRLINREWERTLGWSLEEIHRDKVDILAENYPDPEYRKQVQDFVLHSHGEWRDFKTRVRDGRVIDTSWVMLHLPDGTSIGIGQDITPRKRAEEALRESEERFRQLAENIKDLFWIKTADFNRVLYLSPVYESMSGHPREERYRDSDYQAFLDRIYPEDREKMARIMESGVGEEFDVEFRIVRDDGSMRWIHDRGFPIRDESGKVYRIAGIAHDITDRKLAEEALRESEERFRQLDREHP